MEEKKDINNEELNNAEVKEEAVNQNEDVKDENVDEVSETEETSEDNDLNIIKTLKEENEKLKEELDGTKDRLLRLTAEYDNYRKRTVKEKEGIYSDAYVDVLKEIIPIIDNLERAVAADGSLEDLKKGIEMTMKGCQDSFAKLGVQEIDTTGEFDPNLHNAVMHIEDENLGKNAIAEVFQKDTRRMIR